MASTSAGLSGHVGHDLLDCLVAAAIAFRSMVRSAFRPALVAERILESAIFR